MIVTLKKRDVILVERVEIADRFWSRTRGLLGVRRLGPDRGLLLTPCSAVHTFFMRFPIDLVFLDSAHRVVRCVWNLRPGRLAKGGHGARSVLELETGWFPADKLRPGDIVSLVP